MRTVQDYLISLDKEKLIDAYMRKYPCICNDLPYKKKDSLNPCNVYTNIRKSVSDYIEWLKEIEVAKSDQNDISILYASMGIGEDEFSEVVYHLCYYKEICQDVENAPNYSYMVTRRQESVGYYVAETRLTKTNLYDLIADYLYESSYFGFKEETFTKKVNGMVEVLAESENSEIKTNPLEEVFDEICAKYNFIEARDARQEDAISKDLHHKIIEAVNEYSKYWMIKQRKEIIELVSNDENFIS